MAATLLLLAACETDPATDVDSTAATLNGRGECYANVAGSWRYQIRDTSAGTGWQEVGPEHGFSCPNYNTTPSGSQLQPERISGLAPGHRHEFRIRTYVSNPCCSTQSNDSVGTQNGTNYDAFWTPDVSAYDASGEFPEQLVGSPDGNAIPSSCKVKEIKNVRRMNSTLGTHLLTIRLTTAWMYCNGWDIRKMYEAGADCNTTTAGAIAGWTCGAIAKVRATNNGGNPEHGAYTYSYNLEWRSPIWGDVVKSTKRWCATNQISGSGAHRRHGSCDVQPW